MTLPPMDMTTPCKTCGCGHPTAYCSQGTPTDARERAAEEYAWRHFDQTGTTAYRHAAKLGFLAGYSARDEEVRELKQEIERLRGALIRTPDELHRISAGVERMGFGERALAKGTE